MNLNPKAKRILVYGDSITWGRVPSSPNRADVSIRWTGVLQRELGEQYEVIEEGLRGRMAKNENPYFENKDGFKQFFAIYPSHLPIDILIIFLGTNDTNQKADKPPEQIAEDLKSYLPLIQKIPTDMDIKAPEKIIFVGIPFIDSSGLKEETMFTGASEKSQKLPSLIKQMAEENGCLFFDASKIATPSKNDGVHLDEENNAKLGKSLANYVKNLFV